MARFANEQELRSIDFFGFILWNLVELLLLCIQHSAVFGRRSYVQIRVLEADVKFEFDAKRKGKGGKCSCGVDMGDLDSRYTCNGRSGRLSIGYQDAQWCGSVIHLP